MLTLQHETAAADVAADTPPAAPPLLMTPTDLADELQVSERSIRRLHERGKIGPATLQIGRAVRYRREEVARWIAAGAPDRDTWRNSEAAKRGR